MPNLLKCLTTSVKLHVRLTLEVVQDDDNDYDYGGLTMIVMMIMMI